MTQKTYAFLNSNCNCDCSDEPQDFCCNISKYEKYLRKCYKIPDSIDIAIKQGFILKEYSDSNSREKLMETEFDIDNVINREIEITMGEMQKFIDESAENIEILEIQSDSQAMSEVLIYEEIRSETECLFTKLSTSIKEFTGKIYQKIYILLVQAVDEVTESSGNLSAMPNPEKELTDKMDSWMKNLKNQVLNYIDSATDDTYLKTKGYVQKRFFKDVFSGVINFFKGIG